MRISLISGSLALGMDGVGDYTRSLARAAHQLGHELQLLSLCDAVRESSNDNGLQVERYADGLSSPEVSNCINAWNPEVISLQFVGFAYHRKGLIHQLIPLIQQLRQNRSMHLMVHEPWIRRSPATTLRQQLLGILQKQQLKRAVSRWKPECIHTSNPHYQKVLRDAGITAKLLPLFGNIGYYPLKPDTLQTIFGTAAQDPKNRIVLFPFSQPRHWSPEPCLQLLRTTAEAADVKLMLLQIGNNTNLSEHWPRIESFAEEHGWNAQRLGLQPESVISQCMQLSAIGISGEHPQLSGKSGAVTAMLEHQLPVICSGTNYESGSNSPSEEPLIYTLDAKREALLEYLKEPIERNYTSRLSQIAQLWIQDLEQFCKP